MSKKETHLHSSAFRRVEYVEHCAAAVGDSSHHPAHRVDFSNEMPLANTINARENQPPPLPRPANLAHAADAGVARQLPYAAHLVGHHQRSRADSRGGGGSLAACFHGRELERSAGQQ